MTVKKNYRFAYRWKQSRPGGLEGSSAINIFSLSQAEAEQEARHQLRQKYPDCEIEITFKG